MDRAKNSTTSLILLSHLLLSADEKTSGISTTATQRNQEMSQALAMYGPQEFGGLWGLASSHHVIMRAFPRLQDVMLAESSEHSDWVDRAIVKESARIEHALSFLSPICDALSETGRTWAAISISIPAATEMKSFAFSLGTLALSSSHKAGETASPTNGISRFPACPNSSSAT